MAVSKKIKANKNKIEQNNSQFNLERQTALSSKNVIKYGFLWLIKLAKMFYQKKTC